MRADLAFTGRPGDQPGRLFSFAIHAPAGSCVLATRLQMSHDALMSDTVGHDEAARLAIRESGLSATRVRVACLALAMREGAPLSRAEFARAMPGRALDRVTLYRTLRRFEEAERLLLESYEKLDPPSPPLRKLRRGEALERIVGLYEAWGKPEKAAEWRAK